MERRKNDKLDQEELERVLEKDEQETRYDRVIEHRKKLKRTRRRIKILIVLFLIGTISIYMLTSLSNVKILKVNNNIIYSQQQILDKASLKYNDKLVFHPAYCIEKVLEEDELIKDVSVRKDYFSGSIYIDVTEEKVIGHYSENGKNYVLLVNGKSVEFDDTELALISSPYIVDLNEEQRELLAESFLEVDSDDIALVSEIRYFSTSYDDNMLKLLMQDGRIVFTAYSDVSLLKNYRGMLEKDNGKIRCFHFLEGTFFTESKYCE